MNNNNYAVVLLKIVIDYRNTTKKRKITKKSTTIPKNAYCGSLCFYNKMIVAELRFIVVLQYTPKKGLLRTYLIQNAFHISKTLIKYLLRMSFK